MTPRRTTALTALLALCSAASAGTLPNTPQTLKAVSIQSSLSGVPLEAALASISRQAGLTLIAKDLPKTTLNTSFSNKPFKVVFTTLLALYGKNLDYALLKGNILVVGPAEAVLSTVATFNPAPTTVGTTTVGTSAMTSATGTISAPVIIARPVLATRVLQTAFAGALAPILTDLVPNLKLALFNDVLLLQGTQADLDTASDLIVKVEKLRAGDPANAALLPAKPTEAPRPILKLYALKGSPERVLRALKIAVPDISADAIDGTLYVSATPEQQTQVAQTVSVVDVAPIAPVAPVAGATPLPRYVMSYPVLGDGNELVAALSAFEPSAKVKYLTSSGLLVIEATGEEHSAITDLLSDINLPESSSSVARRTQSDRSMQTYRLKYTKASDVVTQLNTTVKGQAAAAAASAAAPSAPAAAPASPAAAPAAAAPAPVEPPTFSADDRTNSVIVVGTRAVQEQVARTIASLDVPVRQVKLNVRIEKISDTTGQDLGLDWKIGFGGVSLSGGATGLALGYNALSAPVDLQLKLNALRSTGKSTTVMDNNFVVTDNQLMKLVSGGDVLREVPVFDKDGKLVTTTLTKFDEFGLKVNLQPRIGANGAVELDVVTEMSSQPVPGSGNTLIKPNTTLSNRIAFNSGGTVVLGGLITNANVDATKGIPLLSQIPIIGNLFKTTTSSVNKETLLIIISGTVIDLDGKPVTVAAVPVTTAGAEISPTGGPASRSSSSESNVSLPNH